VKTQYTVIPVQGPATEHEVDWPAEPGYRVIKGVVEPLLGEGEPLEHVSVLWAGKRADMFVSEYGHMQLTTRAPLPRNEAATAIYRANWLRQHPDCDPETLPWIAGTAVLFHRIIWV
jgi:hypothetical protein